MTILASCRSKASLPDLPSPGFRHFPDIQGKSASLVAGDAVAQVGGHDARVLQRPGIAAVVGARRLIFFGLRIQLGLHPLDTPHRVLPHLLQQDTTKKVDGSDVQEMLKTKSRRTGLAPFRPLQHPRPAAPLLQPLCGSDCGCTGDETELACCAHPQNELRDTTPGLQCSRRVPRGKQIRPCGRLDWTIISKC